MEIIKPSYKIVPDLLAQGVKLTPMMEQYHQIKMKYSDSLLFFRMGDFFELFFEDAIIASKYLNITLTNRGQLGSTPIPMSGFPHHAAANYVDKLTSIGHRVVICDQVEDPRASKGIVKRAVVQICSPGMPYDIDRSQSQEQHFVASFYTSKTDHILSLLDFVHGDFVAIKCHSFDQLMDYFRFYRPKEVLCALSVFDKNPDLETLWEQTKTTPTYISEEYLDFKNTQDYQNKVAPYLKYDSHLKNDTHAKNVVFALTYYLYVSQNIENATNIKKLRWIIPNQFMSVSNHTLTGLEILPKSMDMYKQSLLGWCDYTKTSMGFRKLKEWFLYPLKDLSTLIKRQEDIKKWRSNWNSLEQLRSQLDQCRDIHRILAKNTSKKVNASDLINLSQTFFTGKSITENFSSLCLNYLPSPKTFNALNILSEEIKLGINEEIGATLEKGNLFKKGYHQERDSLLAIHETTKFKVEQLEENYKKSYAKLGTLRIKSNNISGYYIEISKGQAKFAPKNFERLQTLTNVERFISPELKKIELNLLRSKDRLLELDRELFKTFQEKVINTTEEWLLLAEWISYVDVIQSMSFLAEKEQLITPEIGEAKELTLSSVWHPLLKDQLKEKIVSHNISFTKENYFALITGPNMAGKTTVMREVALCAFLTQIGSCVPATFAKMPLFDSLFSRLGANDDILNGQSTFMVEMSEMSEILRNATSLSLILVDEIGRGTSTHDGLSLAQAILEFLCKEIRAITLFSTHYHELIECVEKIPEAKNYTVKTAVKGKDIEFIYDLIEGGATQSFGIHVAKLAGVPQKILSKASQILKSLESNNNSDNKIPSAQIELFETHQNDFEITEKIKNINIENTTPIEALLKLKELKEIHLSRINIVD